MLRRGDRRGPPRRGAGQRPNSAASNTWPSARAPDLPFAGASEPRLTQSGQNRAVATGGSLARKRPVSSMKGRLVSRAGLARDSTSAPMNTRTVGTSVPEEGRPTRGRLTRPGLEFDLRVAQRIPRGFRVGLKSPRALGLRDRRLWPWARRGRNRRAPTVRAQRFCPRSRCSRLTPRRSRVYRDW